jgi:hypothetical protein
LCRHAQLPARTIAQNSQIILSQALKLLGRTCRVGNSCLQFLPAGGKSCRGKISEGAEIRHELSWHGSCMV